jgi:hypothetical protein
MLAIPKSGKELIDKSNIFYGGAYGPLLILNPPLPPLPALPPLPPITGLLPKFTPFFFLLVYLGSLFSFYFLRMPAI